ncbi:TetR/AcrR family transcriptional regulator [Actinomycetospora sp. C-140]
MLGHLMGVPPAEQDIERAASAGVGGRPRNAEIDRHVLEVALRHLRSAGLPGLSVAAVAEEAGTTRAAVYRRWTGRTELAVAALGTIADGGLAPATGDSYADLVAELERFRRFVAETDATALVAVALLQGTHARVREQVRHQLVEPRRRRLRDCLAAGVAAGALRAQADHATAEDLLAGSWLAHAACGEDLGDDWARRTAAMVWAACGGVPG